MRFGTIIIGDELLSGKRQDRHFAEVVRSLSARGLELAWCRIIGDDPVFITDTLMQTLASGDAVFCFGGIGATPDDHTRASAARACGVALEFHADAVREIEARYGDAAYPQRIRLAELPAGSVMIPNPYNRVPGFSLRHHHFLPGFPEMAWPMLEWVLDMYYGDAPRTRPAREHTLTVWAREGELIPLMEALVARFPRCRLSSLPQLNKDQPCLELGVRGDTQDVEAALEFLRQGLAGMKVRWREPPAT